MLRELRETKGFTQVELAEKAKVGRTYLTKLETGKKGNPSRLSSSDSPRPSACQCPSCCHEAGTQCESHSNALRTVAGLNI